MSNNSIVRMPREKALKHLQNLFSWSEFYVKLGQHNREAAEKTKKQIEEHKRIYNL